MPVEKQIGSAGPGPIPIGKVLVRGELKTEIPIQNLMSMRAGARLGLRLQKEIGMALFEDYKGGMTYEQVSEKHDIASRYNVTPRVAVVSVANAIRGRRKPIMDVEPYPGLVGTYELDALSLSRKRAKGIEMGNALLRSKRGLFALKREEMRQIYIDGGRLGGLASGRANYEKGIGIHAQSHEKMAQNSRKANIALGNTPWIEAKDGKPAEIELAIRLSNGKEFQHNRGSWKGKPMWGLIARVLNQEYHKSQGVRTAAGTKSMVKYRIGKKES